jgi:c-di-AMP phosphodiesterase-like protein
MVLFFYLIYFVILSYCFHGLNVVFLYLIILILVLIIVLLKDYNMRNQNQKYRRYVDVRLGRINECNLLRLQFGINIGRLVVIVN